MKTITIIALFSVIALMGAANGCGHSPTTPGPNETNYNASPVAVVK